VPFTFGYGERKDFADRAPYKLDPATYGDVSPLVHLIKRDPRKDIKLKGRFVRPGEAGYNPSGGTPGPKYDVSAKQGEGVRRVYFNGRPRHATDVTPGPGQYETRSKAGRNYPLVFGTLYDVTLKGRNKPPDNMAWKNPGPGAYTIHGFSDKYNVAPIPGHKKRPAKSASAPDLAGESTMLLAEEAEPDSPVVGLADMVDSRPALPGAVEE
jgi:hypothetical protein